VTAVRHGDLYGLRRDKYAALAEGDVSRTQWEAFEPAKPFYLFKPYGGAVEEEYGRGFPLPEIIPVNSVGVVTARDNLTIDFDGEVLWRRVGDFASFGEEEARAKYDLGKDVRDWKVRLAQEDVRASGPSRENVKPILYRPFDVRATYYTGVTRGFICMPRRVVMRHMLAGENLGLITTRQTRDEWGGFVTDSIIGHKSLAAYDINSLFPLYLYEGKAEFGIGGRVINISPEFGEKFLAAVGALSLDNSPEVGTRSGSREVLYPEDIFYYIYGVLHSPTYRSRYAVFLKIDFPRIPLPKNYECFDRLATAGEKLAALHLLKDKANWDWRGIGQRPDGGTDTTVGKVAYDEKNQAVIFDAKKPPKEQVSVGPVPENIWEFHIGGYQVLQKWLKDRKGRKVDLGDYIPIIVALIETDRVMKEECDPAFKEMMGF